MNWNSINKALQDSGISIDEGRRPQAIGGGAISAAWKVQTADSPVFLKTGSASAFAMFEAEAQGLRELAGAKAIRIPRVLAVASHDAGAVIALEWLELGTTSPETQRILGRQLAELHRRTHDSFGWSRDNTIGLTPQHNDYADRWPDFFREQRLEYQLRRASDNGFRGELQTSGRALLGNLDRLFEDHSPDASLLHGDLWGGNWSSVNGQPVIFDPAVYYGDRETDLAMTRLFGGFSAEFYRAYESSWPLNERHEQRISLYQLYHVLNHLNLFGASYLGRAQSMISDLLKAAT
jgi:protein-ribulosamine 3-kinase